MVRFGDLVHAGVFVACVAAGGIIARMMDRTAVEGVGYGLVGWVTLVLGYLVLSRLLTGKPQPQTSPAADSSAAGDDDGVIFEDGKND